MDKRVNYETLLKQLALLELITVATVRELNKESNDITTEQIQMIMAVLQKAKPGMVVSDSDSDDVDANAPETCDQDMHEGNNHTADR